jgi:Mor family transcriptional regulator
MTTDRNNNIIADYLAGAQPRDIADYYKLTDTAIYNILRKYNIKLVHLNIRNKKNGSKTEKRKSKNEYYERQNRYS